MVLRRGARSLAVCGLLGLPGLACVEYERASEEGGPGEAVTGPQGETSGGATPTSGGDEVGEAECDLWAQDCPPGNKCAPYDKDGDGIHDTPRCVPVDGAPDQAGDDCSIAGSIASGIDSCDLGLMCWNVDG
ncbi:MAG: hypothetical protein JNK56_34490, partial [Myxococcales bacterium]|nr:hypothetical protein [Myxococcales bacterium]